MESFRKRYKNRKINPAFLSAIILACILFLTVGYSTIQASLDISNISAIVRVEKDVRVTGITLASSSSSAVSYWEEYNVNDVFSSIVLPNSDSTITYNINITNIGNTEAAISDITGLPSNLTYTVNNYSFRNILCDNNNSNLCKLGSTTTISITVGYDENGYDSENTDYNIEMNFSFVGLSDSVARISNKLYSTLQNAVNDVPTNNTQTTITILNDTSESVSIARYKNIILDLNNKTISNNGDSPVIVNNGTMQIIGGTITSSAAKNGAINNESYGILTISSGSVVATGGRQALYNNKGVATITGSAYLSAVTNERAAVQNLSASTLTITGGTIVSTGSNAVQNEGTMTIGVKDSNINRNSLLIKGELAGIYSTVNFNYYDGTAKGKTVGINSASKVADVEMGYQIVTKGETIDGDLYSVNYLGNGYTVTFDPGDGTVDETTRYVEANDSLGPLPLPTYDYHSFTGWFTQNDVQISTSTTITGNTVFVAHWTEALYTAMIGDDGYQTLQGAVDAVADNDVKVEIKLLKNIDNENIVVSSGQNIEFDLQSYTISNTSGMIIHNSGTILIKNGYLIRNGSNDQNRVIKNESSGSVTITGGEIKSNCFQTIQNYGTINITGGKIWGAPSVDQGIINNENSSSVLNVSGGQIIGTKRQAIYNNGGRVTISGSAILSNGNGATANRACVQNVSGTIAISGGTITSPSSSYPALLNNSTMNVTGGTITSSAFNAVNNASGTLTIGSNDGNLNISSPIIVANKVGVSNSATFNFYDGTIKGITNATSGTVTYDTTRYQLIRGTEFMNGDTYKIVYLADL